ncbi:hemerythrin domain-containing protein [Brevibacillus migulae]|uniref:hemerythrin domain-containing protein n=1 Tax=Brevibacillus migulae TaxID=1644114 RepID=UPI00106E259B|nr:hemerythrin domain-containing protein [Brevibacillus migulae]
MKTSGYQPKLDLNDWQTVTEKEYERVYSIIAPELHSFVEEHAALGHLMDQVRIKYDEEIYQQALREIETELSQHFYYEETFILPRLSRYFATDEVGPCMKLLQEHGTIRKNFRDAAELFTTRNAAEPSKDLVQKMNLLAYLLKKHIEKEDHYFFPMVSLILSQAEKDEIAAEVKAAYEARGKQ